MDFNSTTSKFSIDATKSNDRLILENMEKYMINGTLPKDYCKKQYNRILNLYDTKNYLNNLSSVCDLLDFYKQLNN